MAVEEIDGIEYSECLTKIIKANCNLSEDIAIEEWVEELSTRSFFYCRFIKAVKLPKALSRIGDWCFEGCSGLTNFKGTTKIRYIGIGAFYNCSSLETVVLMNGVKAIYGLTFAGCTKLRKIKIPSSVKFINGSAFKRCYSLEEIEYKGVKYKCRYCKEKEEVVIEGTNEGVNWIFEGVNVKKP